MNNATAMLVFSDSAHRLSTIVAVCLAVLGLIATIPQNLRAQNPPTSPAEVSTALSTAQGKPQVQWSMTPQEISHRVDQMISEVNQSNPIARNKQDKLTRTLRQVRDAAVRNDVAAYQKSVAALAALAKALTPGEAGKLNLALQRSNAGGANQSCETSCIFGSCKIQCSAGAGGGAYCGCILGFPQCACGGGGGAIAKPATSAIQ